MILYQKFGKLMKSSVSRPNQKYLVYTEKLVLSLAFRLSLTPVSPVNKQQRGILFIIVTTSCKIKVLIMRPLQVEISHSLTDIPFTLALQNACTALYVVRATSAISGLHAGNMKFNRQNEWWVSMYRA
jgi:hypothetical protein